MRVLSCRRPASSSSARRCYASRGAGALRRETADELTNCLFRSARPGARVSASTSPPCAPFSRAIRGTGSASASSAGPSSASRACCRSRPFGGSRPSTSPAGSPATSSSTRARREPRQPDGHDRRRVRRSAISTWRQPRRTRAPASCSACRRNGGSPPTSPSSSQGTDRLPVPSFVHLGAAEVAASHRWRISCTMERCPGRAMQKFRTRSGWRLSNG